MDFHSPRWNQSTRDWGASAGIQPRPFLINPPRCNYGGDIPTRISMRSWQQPGRWLPRDLIDPLAIEDYVAWSPETDGCEFLPRFQPELDMRPVVRAAGSPSSYEVKR